MTHQIKSGLYHKDIYLPKIAFRSIDIVLNYTYHAIEAADNDRYGQIELPETINFSLMEVVEMEFVDGKLYKAVVRTHHDQKHDLALVVLIDGFRVKTVWLNRKDDKHQTLDHSKYVAAPIKK